MHAITCYPSPNKKKGLAICEAFAKGAGGTCAEPGTDILADGAAVFYGMTEHTLPLITQCRHERRDWYYIDNAYYYGRGTYYRITKDRLMHDGIGVEVDPDFPLINWFGVDIRPWREPNAGPIVVTTQSELFYRFRMRMTRDQWIKDVIRDIRIYTDRPIEVCNKPDPKDMAKTDPHSREFEPMMRNAWALVTHSSSTAVKALADGVPVFWLGLGDDYATARHMSRHTVAAIEKPLYAEARAWFIEALLSQQWTIDEMRGGQAWFDLCE